MTTAEIKTMSLAEVTAAAKSLPLETLEAIDDELSTEVSSFARISDPARSDSLSARIRILEDAIYKITG
jgi:hypothetical protein